MLERLCPGGWWQEQPFEEHVGALAGGCKVEGHARQRLGLLLQLGLAPVQRGPRAPAHSGRG